MFCCNGRDYGLSGFWWSSDRAEGTSRFWEVRFCFAFECLCGFADAFVLPLCGLAVILVCVKKEIIYVLPVEYSLRV